MSSVFATAIGIGIVAGLRSLTAPAVVTWAAHLGWLNLNSSPLAFMGSTWAVVIFSIFAVGELIVDKLPQTPRRTAPVGLLARIITGGLGGGCICAASGQSLGIGALTGAIGGVIGAFGGFEIRRRLVHCLRIHDSIVAIFEDLIAIVFALFIVSR